MGSLPRTKPVAFSPEVFASVEAADASLPKCPRPCVDCDPGHHWYWDAERNTHEEEVPMMCKHCEAKALVSINAADLPEV